MYNVTVHFEGTPGKAPEEVVYEGVPESITQEQFMSRLAADHPGKPVAEVVRRRATTPEAVRAEILARPDAAPASAQAPAPGYRTSAASPAGFPSVSPSTQQQRDTTRLQILEQEPPSPTRDRELALLRQGGGAYPNLVGVTVNSSFPAAAPAAAPAAEPALDPESQIHQNRALTQSATGDDTPRARQLAADAERQTQIDALRQEVRDLAKLRLAPVERSRLKREINDRIAALEAQQSSDPYSAVGGTVGAVAGGVGGSALGPGGGIVGSMGLGLLGTLIGAATYANANNFTQQERDDYLKTKGIESIAFDAAGNLIFGTGKGLVSLAKGTGPYTAVLKLLGGKIGRAPGAARIIGSPAGEKVFRGTSEPEFMKATQEAADLLNTGERAIPTSAFTGTTSVGEATARAKAPGEFAAAGREGKGLLETKVDELLANIRGPRRSEFSGTDLRATLENTEAAVKAKLKPTWQELEGMRGADTVDFREVRDMARNLLELNRTAKVKVLTGEKLDWARRLAGGELPEGNKHTFKGAEVLDARDAAAQADRVAYLSPGEAQDVLTKLKAIVRDADNPVNPNSDMRAFAQQAAGKLHSALDAALASDPKFAEARALYNDMMTTLYDPALDAARRGGESAAGSKAVKLGEVEGVRALENVKRLAHQIDISADKGLSSTATAAYRGAVADFVEQYAGTPEAMAGLHRQMAKPGFRKTFEAAVPDPQNRLIIERFSAAAQALQQNAQRGGGGMALEGAAATGGRIVGNAVGMGNTLSLVGRLLSVVTTRKAAEAYTRPEMQVIMPKVTAWMLNAARGNARPLSTVPQEVRDFATSVGIELQGTEARE